MSCFVREHFKAIGNAANPPREPFHLARAHGRGQARRAGRVQDEALKPLLADLAAMRQAANEIYDQLGSS